MNPRTMARIFGAGRIVVGVTAVVAPAAATRGWIGASADEAPTQAITRAFGVREIAVGIGNIVAAGHPRGAAITRGLAACDAVDVYATIAARGSIPTTGLVAVTAVAAGAVAGSFVLAQQLGAAA